MKQAYSSYYPPRAGRRSCFRPLLERFQRWMSSLPLDRGNLPMPLLTMVAALLIPGYIYRRVGYPKVFVALIAGYFVCLLVFFAFLGFFASTVAYMLMLSAHVSSAAELIKRLTPSLGLRFRVISTVAVFLFLNTFVYGFSQGLIGRFIMPIEVEGKVVVVRRCSPETIRVGDTIAHRIESAGVAGIYIRRGLGFDRVLAGPHQTLRFSTNALAIQGTLYPKQPRMPVKGEWSVQANHWFVWPTLNIEGYNIPEEAITGELMRIGMVSHEDLVGKPFKRWFWREQL